jgi:sterol 24-C-methyltransferase
MEETFKAIDKYYRKIESRLGYKFVLGDAKHFGYYPNKISDISESKALRLQQDLIGSTLDLKTGERVLDAGCGRGVTACYLAEKYSVNVTGIDILDFEIKSARKRLMRKGLEDWTEFLVMDFGNLEFLDQSFDAIYTSETLSHAPNVNEVLEGFFKILKPGGKIVLMEYTLATDENFTKEQMESLEYVIAGSAMFGLKQFRHDHFREVLTAAGFSEIQEHVITDHIRPSFDRLYEKSKWAYRLAKFFGFSRHLINTSTPTLLRPLLDDGLIRYCLFFAVKPSA